MGMVLQFASAGAGGTTARRALLPVPTRYSTAHNVNIHDAAAIGYWCRHFDTTAERLIAAVKKVGSNPSIVRLELRVR